MSSSPDDIDWSLTTWEGCRREQLRRWAELDFDEILRAQEEMAELADIFGHEPVRHVPPPPSAQNPGNSPRPDSK